MAATPKRLWILNGDSSGLGTDTRRYQSTRAAMRGWRWWRCTGGHMVLMSATGPQDFTTEFEKLHWPSRDLFDPSSTGMTTTADPTRQAAYDHHMTVCLADTDEVQKTMTKDRRNPHRCAWVDYTASMHKAYLEDIADNAAIIENLLTSKGIT